MKAVIAVAFVAILAALAAAGVFMLRRPPPGEAGTEGRKRMARALAVRVGVSVALFLLILFSYWMGWIQPKGVPVMR